MMKIKILTIGCRLNQAEIQSVATRLQELGHELTNQDDAEIYIVNSCVVTEKSEKKTRKLIYRAIKAAGSRPEQGRIFVTGCAAGTLKQEGNMVYVSNDYKHLIPEFIENRDMLKSGAGCVASRFGYCTPVKATRTRVHLKIQDGCDNFCSYCIVPLVRGKPQSKPVNQVVSEFNKLLDAGYKEIVITGVMIGSYQWEGEDLTGLVAELVNIPGTFRIHLSSLNPNMVTPQMIELLSCEKLVKHLHLSLQSGSNETLKKMKRRYTREEYLSLAGRIKESLPLFNLTSDLIVGFPGESEKDFQDSVDLIREVGFSHIHTFRYSARPGTKAAEMTDTVPESEKRRRSNEVVELYMRQKAEYYGKFNSIETIFLSEMYKKGYTSGFNEYYVPVVVSRQLRRNQFFKIRTFLDEKNYRLRGEITEENRN